MYDESVELREKEGDYPGRPGRRHVPPSRKGRLQNKSLTPRSIMKDFPEAAGYFAFSDDEQEEDGGDPIIAKVKPSTSRDKQFLEAGGADGGASMISLASSYAKKLMSSGAEKGQEKHLEPAPRAPPRGGRSTKESQQDDSESSEEEEDGDVEEGAYGGMNMAQIEGLLKRVANPSSSLVGRYLPRPATTSRSPSRRPQPKPRFASGGYLDVGDGGDPNSAVRPPPPPPTTSTTASLNSQFHPGFSPAATNLMNVIGRPSQADGTICISSDESDAEVSISENEMDFATMDELMDMYTGNTPAQLDGRNPGSKMIRPTPEVNNFTAVDDEVMENMVAHRKMWEYQLDLKREQLRRRTLVISDFPGVHAADHEAYNPQDYEHLNVPPEVKSLFQHITCYEPSTPQMDIKLKPFIPEYYPSVGDIDAFLKVVHPEVPEQGVGINYLDEPSSFQSDPSVLDLRLRALAKQSSSRSVMVKKIDNVAKNSKIIENWIKDISDLHRSKPSPSVHYLKPMPDIDSLIQEWPAELEDLLKTSGLPTSQLDCDLSTFVDIVCTLLDIPVYKSRIESLHVLFMLYATFKQFKNYVPIGFDPKEKITRGDNDNHPFTSAAITRLEEDSEVDRLVIINN